MFLNWKWMTFTVPVFLFSVERPAFVERGHVCEMEKFTGPPRIYTLWQRHCFYAEVEVKNISLTFAAAQTFTSDDECFWPGPSDCESSDDPAVAFLTFQTEASCRSIQMFSHRCTLMRCLLCLPFQSLPIYPLVTTAALKLRQHFFWLHKLLFQQFGLFCFELWNPKPVWKIFSSENKS